MPNQTHRHKALHYAPPPSRRTVPILLVAVLLLLAAGPGLAAAASFQFSVTVKTAFDKMTAAADKALAAKLTEQYGELQRAQKLTIEWEAKADKLHYRNEEAELAAKERIKQVGAAKLAKLEAEALHTKKKYEPLFALYDSLKQQHSLAKAAKNKWLAGTLAPQVETAKAAVKLAKLDIRAKEEALRAAKAHNAKTIKELRSMLAAAQPVSIKIKAAKSAVGSLNKQFSAEAAVLNLNVRKGEATASLSSLIRMNAYVKQINAHRASIYSLEQQIAGIIAKVNAQPVMG